ncbi:MAG: hypothetical protein RLZZ324_736 [Candidatus Parcubacteria bacterium]|jgi:tetratricopeptide (TPR) repeat protein
MITPSTSLTWTWRIFGWFLLTAMALFVFSLNNAFVYDDVSQIAYSTDIRHMQSVTAFFAHGARLKGETHVNALNVFYRPMMFSAYTLLYALFGLRPWAFHIPQIAIFAANASLLYCILGAFVRRRVAAFAAAAYLLHPLSSDTAIYAANLQDALYAFFGLWALYLLVAVRRRVSWKRGCAIAALLVFSMLSKESGFAFLGLSVLFVALFRPRDDAARVLTPITAGMALMFALRAHAMMNVAPMLNASRISLVPLGTRMLSLPKALAYYFGRFLWPNDLAVGQEWIVRAATFQAFWIPFAFVTIFIAGLIALSTYAGRRERQHVKPLLFFWVWALGGLALHAQIIPLDMTAADRWFVLPMSGILGILAISADAFLSAHPRCVSHPYAKYGAAMLLATLAILTMVREFQWHSPERLYAHDIEVSEMAPQAETLYGGILSDSGRYAEAQPHLQAALRQYPESVNAASALACNAYKLGHTEDARKMLRGVIAAHAADELSLAYFCLAQIQLDHDGNARAARETARLGLAVSQNQPYLLQIELVASDRLKDGPATVHAARMLYGLYGDMEHEQMVRTALARYPEAEAR